MQLYYSEEHEVKKNLSSTGICFGLYPRIPLSVARCQFRICNVCVCARPIVGMGLSNELHETCPLSK